jgi:hypothetical protein
MAHSSAEAALIREKAIFLLNEKRVTNQIAKLVPLYYPEGILVEKHICYLLGKRSNIQYIELFYIRAYKQNTFTHYLIEWYPFWDLENPPVRFWVQTCVALKKRIFRFTDNMSFLKSTFLYLEHCAGMVRLNLIPKLLIPKSIHVKVLTIQGLHRTTYTTSSNDPPLEDDTNSKSGLSVWTTIETSQLSVETAHLLFLINKEMQSTMMTQNQKEVLVNELLKICIRFKKQF